MRCDLWGAGREHHGAGELAAQIGVENAERRERAGRGGNENAADAQRLRKRAGVQRAGAAEGKQREGTGIVTALDGDAAQGRLHAGVGHAHDAFGEMFDAWRKIWWGRQESARRARVSSRRIAPPRK